MSWIKNIYELLEALWEAAFAHGTKHIMVSIEFIILHPSGPGTPGLPSRAWRSTAERMVC
jgi:hypothetical protein